MQNVPLKWLYIDFNSYFASVEQQLNPALRGKPVAVIPVETESTCAIAASYEAKAFGIKTGTMIYEAKKLCPNLICVMGGHEKYVQYHHKLLEEVDRHIPIEYVCSIDEFACELQGKQEAPEGAIALAEEIKKGISENVGEYIKSSIGISTNRFLAKTASNIQKPNGLTVLHPDEFISKVGKFEPSFLTGVGRSMLKRLNKNQIYTIEQLYALDAKRMRKIWHSVEGERMWHLLRGIELPNEETKKRTVGHSHILGPELRLTPQAKQVARRLLCKAASRLRRLGYYCTELSLSFRIEDGPRVSAYNKFYRAYDTFTLLHQLYALWEILVSEYKPERIKKISISLNGLAEIKDIQPEFLEDLDPTKKKLTDKYETLSKAMDKINSRFGRDSIVVGGMPERTHSFSGTKIAFTRIPEFEEFYE